VERERRRGGAGGKWRENERNILSLFPSHLATKDVAVCGSVFSFSSPHENEHANFLARKGVQMKVYRRIVMCVCYIMLRCVAVRCSE